ncbi:unnamed protein product [Rotaria socialis]|uniref:Uncharacterized protein n=2 Tax=Rotaria socialis TaxID=392032 RepID=A0A818MYG1_9BILA|nr:unnamed protein product [Rotaria socialis]CAF4886807.1 unnamed protein product [Rotaria socialis]
MIFNVLCIFLVVQSTVDPKGSYVKISRRRRRSRGSQPQQQLPDNEILFKVQEMQERLNFEIRQQVALSERMDTIVRLYVNEERALQKVRQQVDGLIDTCIFSCSPNWIEIYKNNIISVREINSILNAFKADQPVSLLLP